MGFDRGFPHLHLHDDNSLKDGIGTPEEYAKIAAEHGAKSLCITNHGSLAGWPRQYWACQKQGIKPIFGVEAYMNKHRSRDVRGEISDIKNAIKKSKDPDEIDELSQELEKLTQFRNNIYRPSQHTILLAENYEGFKNISQITSDAYVNGYYYSPRTDVEYLSTHSEGVIFSTACISGYIPRMAERDFKEAVREAQRLQEIFGKDNFFVELMLIDFEEQIEVNQRMLALAKEIDAPTIVTADVHYPKCTDGKYQDILLLMKQNKTIEDKESGDGWEIHVKDLYYKSLQDMVQVWKNMHYKSFSKEVLIDSINNTFALEDRIKNIKFDTDIKLPEIYEVPQSKLRQLCKKGFKRRVKRGDIPAPGFTLKDYAERLKFELNVIEEKNFSEYFLIIKDVVDHAKEIGAHMGPGRGSAAGSVVSFCLGIVNIDPVRFGLLFERFIAIDRPDPPDIDLDFSPQHRDLIKDYISEKYPTTASIGTISTFGTRSTILDVSKVFGIDRNDLFHITKQIGNKLGPQADDMEWEDIFEKCPLAKEWAENNPEAFEAAKRIRGQNSHRGKHAAGVLVAPEGCMEEIPLMRTKGSIVTAYTDSAGYRELSSLGYLKLDILGVQNVNIVPRAIKEVEKRKGIKIDKESIPLDDEKTIEEFNEDVTGVFQFDTITSRPIIKEVGVDEFMDAAIITSLARPGPLEFGIHEEFAKRKREGDKWKEEVPEVLHDVLSVSKGLMIFQEDIMKVLQIIGNISGVDSNRIRKIIGKKRDESEFEPYWKKFKEGGLENGYELEFLEDLWEKMLTFAGYGFNKSHAVSYAYIAWEQVYMKAHHPLEYFYSLFAETDRGKKKYGSVVLTEYLYSALSQGIPVEPPNVKVANEEFKIHDDKIYFGLGKIKEVGAAGMALQEYGPIHKMSEFAECVSNTRKINITKVKALVFSGALDDVELDDYECKFAGLRRRNDILAAYFHHMAQRQKRASYKKKYVQRYIDAQEDSKSVKDLIALEQKYLGLIFSVWSSKDYENVVNTFDIKPIAQQEDNKYIEVVGMLNRVKKITTKNGNRMAFASICDKSGYLDNITIWPSVFKKYKQYLKEGKLVGIMLKKEKNDNPKYGEYSFFLDERGGQQAIIPFSVLKEEAKKGVNV